MNFTPIRLICQKCFWYLIYCKRQIPKYTSLKWHEWNRLCFVSILCQDLTLEKKAQFLQRWGAIYKWISFMLDCFIKAFVLTQIEHTWVILSIFPTSLPDNVFHFQRERSRKFPCSQVQQVLLIGAFFSATNLLLGYQLEQSDTGKSLCSFKDKGDPTEVTKLWTTIFSALQKNTIRNFAITWSIHSKFNSNYCQTETYLKEVWMYFLNQKR